MDQQGQPSKPLPEPDPLQLTLTRLALVEALVLHRIDREEREAMLDHLDSVVQGLPVEDRPKTLQPALAQLREALNLANAMDKTYKHPVHQGS